MYKYDEQESLDDFLSNLNKRLVSTATSANKSTQQSKSDDELKFASTPAPNAIEWATDRRFLGVDTLYTHVRQYEIIRDLFQLRCPLPHCNDQSSYAADCWGKGKEYLQSENLLVYNEKYREDVCPCCGNTRSDLVEDGLLKTYRYLHVISGMRSGKSSVAATIGTYIEHVMITLGHKHGELYKYFHQLPGQKFDITFIASTDVQSKDTIWAKFTELRRNSEWFNKYVRWIKKYEVEQKTIDGMRSLSYEELDKEIRNDFVGLQIRSLNSSSSGMAGRTRVAAFIDELSRFEVTESARSADEAYRVLDNSLATVRGITLKYKDIKKEVGWIGLMSSISSPISIEDKSMRLLRQAPSIKGMYYKHYATWDFNPEQPRESFDDAFSKDPVGAMRDFGAQPPSAASPLITDPILFKQLAINNTLQPISTFKQTVHNDRVGREYISLILDSSNLSTSYERFIKFDAGVSFDQFAGACAHGEWIETESGRQLITVYDWVIRLIPESKPKRDIWFDFVVQIVEKLVKYYTINRIEFDRWQSTYLIQQIRDRGIFAEMKGTKVEDFVKFVNDVNYSRVQMLPPMENDVKVDPQYMSAQGVVFYELERLEYDRSTEKIGNPRKGSRRGVDSDDVATVVVGVNSMVQNTIVDLSTSNNRKVRLHREQVSSANNALRGDVLRGFNIKRGW